MFTSLNYRAHYHVFKKNTWRRPKTTYHISWDMVGTFCLYNAFNINSITMIYYCMGWKGFSTYCLLNQWFWIASIDNSFHKLCLYLLLVSRSCDISFFFFMPVILESWFLKLFSVFALNLNFDWEALRSTSLSSLECSY